jgi:2-methylcitrate dehydratase PrpD
MGDAPLAQRLSAAARQTVPAEPLQEAIRAVFEVVALARASGPASAGLVLAEALRALAGDGEATVIGTDIKLPAPWAALANAASAARVAGNGQAEVRLSQSAIPVVAAAIAVAETSGASGSELLSAVAAGAEVSVRIHAGIGQSISARGWDEAAAIGGIGAAVAAGRLLGLGEGALTAAVGITSTRAAGFSSALGTDVAAFQVGKAAADGIEAARMAGRGFTAQATSIEGRRGLGYLLADRPSYPAIAAHLGDVWRTGQPVTPPAAVDSTADGGRSRDGASYDDPAVLLAARSDALYEACWNLPAALGLSELMAEAKRPPASHRQFPPSLEKE